MLKFIIIYDVIILKQLVYLISYLKPSSVLHNFPLYIVVCRYTSEIIFHSKSKKQIIETWCNIVSALHLKHSLISTIRNYFPICILQICRRQLQWHLSSYRRIEILYGVYSKLFPAKDAEPFVGMPEKIGMFRSWENWSPTSIYMNSCFLPFFAFWFVSLQYHVGYCYNLKNFVHFKGAFKLNYPSIKILLSKYFSCGYYITKCIFLLCLIRRNSI